VLALELLKVLLENSGEVFQSSERFIAAIKQYLCFSLLKNGASPIAAAQVLSCSIFYTLLMKFRFALKAEVGVFFPMILLRAIEPPAPSAASGTPGERFPAGLHNAAQTVEGKLLASACGLISLRLCKDHGECTRLIFHRCQTCLVLAGLQVRLLPVLLRQDRKRLP
jgi:hypothetical protein